jgi:hypothetical protein
MKESGCLLDERAELHIAVCAMELSVIIVVRQKRAIDDCPIIDAGLKEFGERTPRQHGGDTVHLPRLRDIVSYGD